MKTDRNMVVINDYDIVLVEKGLVGGDIFCTYHSK